MNKPTKIKHEVSMDITTIQPYVTLIKDILTGFAALTAAIVTILGLQAWKQQLKGKTEYELTQKLLRSTYRVRDGIAYARNMDDMVDEILTREESIEGDPSNKSIYRRTKLAYQKRLRKLEEEVSDFESIALEGEALWGQAMRESFSPFRYCISTLISNMRRQLTELDKVVERLEVDKDAADASTKGDVKYSRPVVDEMIGIKRMTSRYSNLADVPEALEKGVVFDGYFGSNPFRDEVNAAVTNIENFLTPHLKI
jgi:hypothetical protein